MGSVSGAVFEDANARSFADGEHQPSGFSRAGYGEPWSVVKPEVVEIGGDLVYSNNPPRLVRLHPTGCRRITQLHDARPARLLQGWRGHIVCRAEGGSHCRAYSKSFSRRVAFALPGVDCAKRLAGPGRAENEANKDKVLKLIGYGLPSLESATTNSEGRVTLITPDAEILPSKQLHLYTIRIPEELRNAALEAKLRIDVTLAYTALPRRTRARRTGYLETWLDWETSKLGEPGNQFLAQDAKCRRIRPTRNFPGIAHNAKIGRSARDQPESRVGAEGLGDL